MTTKENLPNNLPTTRPLKIAYLTMSLAYLGGLEHTTIVKANALAARGHNVSIVSTEDRKPHHVVASLIDPRVNIVTLGVRYSEVKPLSRRWLTIKLRHRKMLQHYIDKQHPDVLVSTGFVDRLPLLLCRTRRAAIIEESHLDRSEKLTLSQRLVNFFNDRIMAIKVDRYVMLTEHDRNLFTGDRSKVVVIPNPLTLKPKRSMCDRPIIISVGRLHWQKDFHALIDVMTRVVTARPTWQLQIWGDGTLHDELQQHIERVHLTDHVKLMGATDDVASALSQASIFANTSLFEGFGLVYLEAMACGLPIVATHNVGSDAVLADSGAGLQRNIGDIEGMASDIIRLIDDEALRHTMSERAVHRSLDFDKDTIIDRVETLYRQLSRHTTKDL